MIHRNSESILMQLCRGLGLERLAWSLRRLHCPVESDALVLEVGSGGNPYFRSNVLLDAYEVTRQRHWAPLIADRPLVLGAVERLPFRDKSFDFVIASHVLEHSADPAAFLSELQRVARAGYIETPDAFMERLNPYRDHRLEVTVRGETLLIRKKAGWQTDPELAELYEKRAKPVVAEESIPRHPFAFHVRHYWVGQIAAKVLNPEVDASWEAPLDGRVGIKQSVRSRVSAAGSSLARAVFSQRARNRKLKLQDLLACPGCRGTKLQFRDGAILCQSCAAEYPVRNRVPVMFASACSQARR